MASEIPDTFTTSENYVEQKMDSQKLNETNDFKSFAQFDHWKNPVFLLKQELRCLEDPLTEKIATKLDKQALSYHKTKIGKFILCPDFLSVM